MERLTVGQVQKACTENKYLRVRYPSGVTNAINCKVAFIGKNNEVPKSYNSPYVGYMPITFQEYISEKNPFTSKHTN